MKIYLSFPKDLPKTSLTIGTFDGVHLGHREIFKKMKKISPHRTVLTFSNHPRHILAPEKGLIKTLTPLPLKLSLLSHAEIDAVIVLPFTKELAHLNFKDLLDRFTLDSLVLGEDSQFGRNREGTKENVKKYAEEKGFSLHYLQKLHLHQKPISSSLIRKYIEEKNFSKAEELLGRPYCLYLPQKESPCLPPDGTYTIFGDKAYTITIESEEVTSIDPEPLQSIAAQFLKEPNV